MRSNSFTFTLCPYKHVFFKTFFLSLYFIVSTIGTGNAVQYEVLRLNGQRITFLKLSRYVVSYTIFSIDRRQVNDYEFEDEDEMELPIVDHVREENALALRQKAFEKRNNITLNYFT